MHILVIDGGHVEVEFREKFGPAHEYTFLTSPFVLAGEGYAYRAEELKAAIVIAEVVFDMGWYSHLIALPGQRIFANAVEESLLDKVRLINASPANRRPTASGQIPFALFGFCGLPTLLNRPLLEVSLYHEADREKLAATCAALGTGYRVVADRVGLVTPRVICMIINEACYTVQEGTATMQAVDMAMQLGTRYPRGPFAWANAIGVERVYAVLEALWQDTHDERYKICPLLKRHALRGEPFAV